MSRCVQQGQGLLKRLGGGDHHPAVRVPGQGLEEVEGVENIIISNHVRVGVVGVGVGVLMTVSQGCLCLISEIHEDHRLGVA